MNLGLTERQATLQREMRAYVSGFDPEEVKRCDIESEFPFEFYRGLAANGWTGIMVPEEYGGRGWGAVEMTIAAEECAAAGVSTLALTLHGQRTLLVLGTPEQRAKYLPGLARGEILSAIVVSEPTVGSSLKDMRTTARRDGDDYVVNGHKTHITLAAEADLLVTFVMTEKGLTTLLIDADTPGITHRKMDAVGWRLEPHYDVEFNNVRVPASNLLGEEGGGMKTFFASFNITRLCNASHLLGIAREAISRSVDYATKRDVGSNKIADFQGIQWIIADLATKYEAASLVRFKAAWMEDQGLPHEKETAMTKLLAVEVCDAATNQAFSIVGSHASYRDQPFERFLRDAKIGHVTGGSAEIMKNNIARSVLSEHGFKPSRPAGGSNPGSGSK
ncbi:acyl-CoA dehydrogenase family protein [Oricola thermophila]|uniref:Acyl-CoA/acyl-ACP dehydrogenase n=1 Tax=Oricola thermophila TaxID=2742145 RepID=A0A6N1VMG3_9HYPH|nr:acyl-CoA dehydrogenase family protein [Oricola thermophila]QKV20177.1 acyl-CoA/acyl-ACP dehydrogenase [Oricola thermophila]